MIIKRKIVNDKNIIYYTDDGRLISVGGGRPFPKDNIIEGIFNGDYNGIVPSTFSEAKILAFALLELIEEESNGS